MSCFNKIVKIIFAAFTFSVFVASALANDHDMKQPIGGLVLQQHEDIAVMSQDVYVSADFIEINYIFLNRSAHDITTTVTFPLPLWPATVTPVSDAALPGPEEQVGETDSFTEFGTWVGSEKISAELRTEHIKAAAVGQDDDVVQNMYYWKQTFPAGGSVSVRHRYKPVVGTAEYVPSTALLTLADASYCPDAGFRASVYYKATREKFRFAAYDDISYVLQAGTNWAGGTIHNFRLVVDKRSPDALVTFCGTDIKKISPTKFEMRAKNFLPRRDLNVLILRNWTRQTQD